ncbi:MAG: hypothetical protein WCA08_22555 [Desulfoferrobacter sp.]
MVLTPEQKALLDCTISHFEDIARQNRFPENSTIQHDTKRCVICHPELLPLDPFTTYLEVIIPSVMVRRPRLDQSLIDQVNNDLALVGSDERVSLGDLQCGDAAALDLWRDWLRNAVDTGLELLSVHSAASREFNLEEAEEESWGELINAKIEELMAYQKQDR